MTEGYWINYQTGKEFPISEHSIWITTGNNAAKLGVPKNVAKNLLKFKLPAERDKLLIYVLKNAPVMRVRGHGSYVTFEYASSSCGDPLDSVFAWAKKNGAGQFTMLSIVNLTTNESTGMTWKDFQETFEVDGCRGVMRAAKSFDKRFAKELLAMAKEILTSRGV